MLLKEPPRKSINESIREPLKETQNEPFNESTTETLRNIKSAFGAYFKEREAEINGSLLAILSGENLLFLGPPGTAKTQLAKSICQSIEGGYFFNYLLTSFSTPEEIFGPLSLKALEEDEFRRKTERCLPSSHVALLDEIFKASSAILNSLLTILNERKYHNGREIIEVPLLSVFGASNELPEEDESLEALYDRFLFRYKLTYIQDEKNFRALLFQTPDDFIPKAHISVSDIEKIRENAKFTHVDLDVEEIITELRKSLQLQEIEISDRRWKRIIGVLKVAAYSSGRQTVDRTMVLLLQHMLWNLPEEKENVKKQIFGLVVSGGINLKKLSQDAEDLKAAVDIALKNELPIRVTCDICGKNFQYRQEIETHHNTYPNHSYILKREGDTKLYPYKNLVKEIDSLQEISGLKKNLSLTQKKVMETEFQLLEKQVNQAKQKLEKERNLLKNLMEANIWLSAQDKNEALFLQNSLTAEISEIEALTREIRNLLGRPILEPTKPSKLEFPKTVKEKVKVQTLDLSNNTNGFIKGLESKLKLR